MGKAQIFGHMARIERHLTRLWSAKRAGVISLDVFEANFDHWGALREKLFWQATYAKE